MSSSLKRILALGIFSMALLASEIALTRIFSVVFWYHFGFLILSTSMLGFGVGGLLIRVFKKQIREIDADNLVSFGFGISGVLLVIALWIITHNHFSPLFITNKPGGFMKLVVVTVALVPPFICMGATVLFMLQRWQDDVGKLYASNLIGSGLGCLAAVLIMDAVGGLVGYLILASLMPIIAAVYVVSDNKKAFAVWMVAALMILSTMFAAEKIYPMNSPEGKPASWGKHYKMLYSDWTSLSKVDISLEESLNSQGLGLWGISPLFKGKYPQRAGVVIDYWAYTTIIKHMRTDGYYDFYNWLPMYVPYKLLDKPKALIIGSGGGMDVRAAVLNGASEIDAVEINPSIFDAMMGKLANYSGNIYKHENVNAHLAEGRRFVESSKDKYDLIQLSGVDTYSATQAGAFALSENFLYTKEAMESYLNHLAPNGILTMTRWYGAAANGYPRFSMRLFTLAMDSIKDFGIENPEKHVLFFRSGFFTVIVIKVEPFTAEEISKVEEEINLRGYQFIYRPDKETEHYKHFYSFVNAKDKAQWYRDYPFNVVPPTDDSPFFFEHRKMSKIFQYQSFLVGLGNGMDGQTILALTLIEMIFASILLMIISFVLQKGKSNIFGWLYFAAIGFGFMLVEVTFSQRLVLFLGHPAYALSVVMFSILVFSGIGSMLSERISQKIPTVFLLLFISVFMLFWAILGTPMLKAMIALPTVIRVIIAVLLLAPPAFCMGTAFPEAVRRLSKKGEKDLGIYWAFNGVFSVTASVLAVIIAMSSGFSTVMLVALISYVIAALTLPFLGRA